MSSAWALDFTPKALKQLKKLDRAVAARIVDALERDLEKYGDPRGFGEAMIGGWTGYWRYRIGDY